MMPTAAARPEKLAWGLLCLFVFLVPWEKSILLPVVGTAARAVGAAAFLTGAVHALRRGSFRRPCAALMAAALFVAWCALTWLWSMDRPMTLARSITMVQLLALLWLFWELARQRDCAPRLMEAYLAGSALAALWTVLRFAAGRQTYYRRYAALGMEPNDLGLTLALAIPLALYLAQRATPAWAWLYRAATALCIAAVLLTASRTALVVSLLGFLYVALEWRRLPAAQRLSGLLLLAWLLLGLFALAPQPSRQRLATIPSELTRGTLHNRTQIWKAGLRLLRRYPLAGVGAGAYAAAVKPWLGEPGRPGHRYVAHNTFLSVLVEGGVIGFLLFGGLLALLVACTFFLMSSERSLWWVLLVGWAVGVSTLTWEHRKLTWLLFALLMVQWAAAFRPAREGG